MEYPLSAGATDFLFSKELKVALGSPYYLVDIEGFHRVKAAGAGR
jgi:hypothetical protein